MNAAHEPRNGNDPDHVQRHPLNAGVWVHLPAPTPTLLGSIDVGGPIPAVVAGTLCAASDRPQRTVVAGWTTWTLRPVGFRVDPAAVDADHLVVASGRGVVISAGQLPVATEQRIAELDTGTRAATWPSADALAVMILGDLLEDVGRVVERLDDEVEDIETAVFAPGRPSVAERIYRLKREVQTVRRCIGPLPELLGAIGADGADHAHADRAGAAADTGVAEAAQLPARARRLVEQLSHVDVLLDSVLSAHQARVAIQQNDDMRRISAWVAIVAAPTAIASIYGMNFRFMPELDWRFGYPVVLVTMLVVCTSLYRLFRRSGWL
jgi:magnesium transporter